MMSLSAAVDNQTRHDYPPGVGATLFVALVAASRIVITEVMANPRGVTGVHMPEDRNEFIEIYNPTNTAIDLNEWTIDDGDAVDVLTAWTDSSLLTVDSSLIIGYSWLNPGGYAVVLDPEYTDTLADGGYVRPYRFGLNTLVLTVENTTLGNGLATTDPVTLVSSSAYGYEDTSTFGTPSDLTDSIPCDAGDGISWERVDAAGRDTVTNWMACRDTAGCTPGAANSSTTFLDLAVTGIALSDSATAKPGEPLFAAVTIANTGFCAAAAWNVTVFLDRNGNAAPDAGEYDTTLAGHSLPQGQAETISVRITCPAVKTDLWARLACDGDGDSTNNSRRLTVLPGGSERMFDLSLSSFSPDGDGFEESLAVLYHLPEAKGTLKVMVFDLRGRQVVTLFSGKPADASGVVGWDGRNSSGDRAPFGVYAVCVEYRNGGTTRTEKLPVVLLRK